MVGLGDDEVVSRGSEVGELAVLDAGAGGEAVLVEAGEGLSRDVEIEVALVYDPHGELAIRVGTDVPVDDGVVVGGDRVAAEDGLLLIVEHDLRLPDASTEHGGVVVRVGNRAEGGVVGRPGSTGARRGAQEASTIHATTARGAERGRREATGARVGAPQAHYACTEHQFSGIHQTQNQEVHTKTLETGESHPQQGNLLRGGAGQGSERVEREWRESGEKRRGIMRKFTK